MTLLILVWSNTDWTTHSLSGRVTYHPSLPHGTGGTLLFAYLGGPALAVLYTVSRLPAGPRIVPLAVGVAWLGQVNLWIWSTWSGGIGGAVVNGALSIVPCLLGLAPIAFFLLNPEGIKPTPTPSTHRSTE